MSSKGKAPGDEPEEAELTRNIVGFFVIGLFNNVSYIIMVSGAKEFMESSAAVAYIACIAPGLLAKITGPFWFDKVSYKHRVLGCGILMFLGFNLVAIGSTYSILAMQLTGVACAGLQAGIGEASFLAYTAHYDARKCLTAWSSGTGFSGMAGYGWNIFFTMGLELDFRIALFAANIIVVGWLAAFFVLLLPPREAKGLDRLEKADAFLSGVEADYVATVADATLTKVQQNGEKKVHIDEEVNSFWKRIKFVGSLWMYMIPLFVVFGTEFAMQSGTWPGMGFPVTEKKARNDFYQYSNWMYQIGVFISRSSGYWLPANRVTLWIMPMLQTLLLIFFYFDALHMFWYDWSVLSLAFLSGLLGGAVYVCAYLLISKELKPSLVELALGSACIADCTGILLGTFGGLVIQCAIYKFHSLPIEMNVC